MNSTGRELRGIDLDAGAEEALAACGVGHRICWVGTQPGPLGHQRWTEGRFAFIMVSGGLVSVALRRPGSRSGDSGSEGVNDRKHWLGAALGALICGGAVPETVTVSYD